MTTANILSQLGSAGVSTGFKNRIINGAMVIDQRNNGASGTANGYFIDRWSNSVSQAAKLTWQQNAGSVTPPAGYTKYLGYTTTTAYTITSTDYFFFIQPIEGLNTYDLSFGTANAQTVTLSFWVRSSLTGTFSGSLRNGTSPTRSYPFSYSISAANTWQQISVTIAGDTSGNWLTTNGTGISVTFCLGSGSTRLSSAGSWQTGDYDGVTGTTSVVGTSGATFYITGVQLEVGTTATNFDYRPYGTELALCQRYCWVWSQTGGYSWIGGGFWTSSTTAYILVRMPVTLRTVPTIVYPTPSTLSLINTSGTQTACTAVSSSNTGQDVAAISATVGSAIGTTGFGTFLGAINVATSIQFNAEL